MYPNAGRCMSIDRPGYQAQARRRTVLVLLALHGVEQPVGQVGRRVGPHGGGA